jgi:hypothetical protein
MYALGKPIVQIMGRTFPVGIPTKWDRDNKMLCFGDGESLQGNGVTI